MADTLLSTNAKTVTGERFVSFYDMVMDDYDALQEGTRFRVINAQVQAYKEGIPTRLNVY